MSGSKRPGLPFKSLRWPLVAAILMFTAGVYASTLGFEFVYDDHAQIVDTRQLDSWTAVPNFFRSHVWSWKTPGLAGTYYRPLFMVWLFILHALFGVTPVGWHLASVAVHLLATLLVYLLAAKLTDDEIVAGVAALFFGIHPGHIESVAWASGIPDPLVAVFLLSSFLFYLRGGRTSRMTALLLFFAALLTKEIAIVLPAIVLGYEWLLGRERPRRLAAAISASIPFIAVTLVYLAIRLSVLHGFTSVINPISRRYMVLTWPSILSFYLEHLVWPFQLSIFYYLPVVTGPDIWRVIVPSSLLSVLA